MDYPANVGGIPTPATVELDSRYEYGLHLPDGKVLWSQDQFYGSGFQTPEERRQIMEAIASAIAKMNLPMQETLGQYQWLKREIRVAKVEWEVAVTPHALDNPFEIGPAAQPVSDGVEDTVGGGYVQS